MTKRQRTSTDFLALTISAGMGTECTASHGVVYKFRVRVQSDATNTTTHFDYFGSIKDHDDGMQALNARELLFAFWAFVNDAQAGDQTFEDFCGDYGYGVDSMTAHRTWEACKRAHVKFRSLWHDAGKFTPGYVLERLADEGIE